MTNKRNNNIKYQSINNNDQGVYGDDDDDIIGVIPQSRNNNGNDNGKIKNIGEYSKLKKVTAINGGSKNKYINWMKTVMYHWKHYFFHTLRVNLRSKLSYCLGFGSCVLVIFTVALCVSIITNTPVVFLSLSEASVGEMDMVLQPGTWTLSNQLNYTMVSELLAGTYTQQNGTSYDDGASSNAEYLEESYHTPRIDGNMNVISASSCPDGNINPDVNLWKYHSLAATDCEPHCFESVCSKSVPAKSHLYIIDSDKEKRMGLGRDWPFSVGPPKGTVYIQEKLANKLSVSKGDTIYLRLPTALFLSSIWTNANVSTDTIPIIYATVTIADTFPSAKGKFSSDQDSAVIIDYTTFIPFISTQFDPEMYQTSQMYISNINLYEYAQTIIINLPPSRLEPYINSNQDTILENIIDFSSKILYKIGFNEFSSSLPVMSELSKNRYVSLFLGLILNVIIFILLFLSILLIYSLLMIDVETRTFEMGVMRMIGTTRSGIIQLMLFKAFSYSIPSWGIGLLLAQIFGFIVSAIFKSITGVPIPSKLTGESVLLASALGLIIPIAASIFPIRNALGKNLHDSLDVKHSKTQAVQISIERSEDNSFSSSVALIGLILSLFGFGIYYIFPLSLLSFNLTLLLNMFFMLLIAMLLGLVSLALNLEQILERSVVYLFLFWEKRAVKSIVIKNLIAHKMRNRKTAIMYAVSLAFIIFVNVSYSMQQTSMNYQVQQSYGSYLSIRSEKPFFSQDSTVAIDNFLSSFTPQIVDYAWESTSFSIMTNQYQSSQITNIGHIYSDNTVMYGVSPNLFATTLPGFLKASEISSDPDYKLNDIQYLSEQIYSFNSARKIIIGTLYKENIGASLDQSFLLQLSIKANQTATPTSTKYLVSPSALLNSAPSFTFSEFPSVTGQDSIVSFPTWVSYASSVFSSVREIPMSQVILKLNTDDKSAIETIKNRLNSFLLSTIVDDFDLLDYYDKIAPNATAGVIINYFFSFTTVLAMMISFFSLMSSVYSNIVEQTKEIGILRAIGIPKSWMIRIYVYESFVLVMASSFLGIFIGSVVGFTMILQRQLYTQLPISMQFPWQLTIIVFICSMIFSFFSAFGPIRKVLNSNIVSIMRVVT